MDNRDKLEIIRAIDRLALALSAGGAITNDGTFATPAAQTTGNVSLASIDSKTPTVGQKTMANSQPVVLASDQSALSLSSVVPGTSATNLGKARNSSVGSTDTIVASGFLRNDTPTLFGTSGNYNIATVDRYGSQIVKNIQQHKRTYSASSNFSVAASATDIFQMVGSATTTVMIQKVIISGIQTTAGNILVILNKKSVVNTGGTAVTFTAVRNETSDIVSTATLQGYTANPSSVGTGISVETEYIPIGSLTIPTSKVVFDFGESGKHIILE